MLMRESDFWKEGHYSKTSYTIFSENGKCPKEFMFCYAELNEEYYLKGLTVFFLKSKM